jgi:hypothetical protein
VQERRRNEDEMGEWMVTMLTIYVHRTLRAYISRRITLHAVPQWGARRCCSRRTRSASPEVMRVEGGREGGREGGTEGGREQK